MKLDGNTYPQKETHISTPFKLHHVPQLLHIIIPMTFICGLYIYVCVCERERGGMLCVYVRRPIQIRNKGIIRRFAYGTSNSPFSSVLGIRLVCPNGIHFLWLVVCGMQNCNCDYIFDENVEMTQIIFIIIIVITSIIVIVNNGYIISYNFHQKQFFIIIFIKVFKAHVQVLNHKLCLFIWPFKE